MCLFFRLWKIRTYKRSLSKVIKLALQVSGTGVKEHVALVDSYLVENFAASEFLH